MTLLTCGKIPGARVAMAAVRVPLLGGRTRHPPTGVPLCVPAASGRVVVGLGRVADLDGARVDVAQEVIDDVLAE